MPVRGTFRVEGLQQLGENLRKLSTVTAKKLAQKATRLGANVIRDRTRANAPVDTGTLKKNIATAKARKTQYTSEYRVIVRQDSRQYGNTKDNVRKGRVGKSYATDGPAFYSKFLEFGTVKMSPKPFMRPAFDQGKEAAVDKVADELRRGIEAATGNKIV